MRCFSVQRHLLARKDAASSRLTCSLKNSSRAYTAAVTTRAPHSALTHISSRGKKETCSSIHHVTSRKLVEAFERMGGLTDVLLSHQDDVADADKYADRFSARVWIHEDDRCGCELCDESAEGDGDDGHRRKHARIPVPGHTRGSVVYLWRDIICSRATLLPGVARRMTWSLSARPAGTRGLSSSVHLGGLQSTDSSGSFPDMVIVCTCLRPR